MTQRILGPFNRVEGDLEIKINSSNGAVTEAFVSSPLFRGFEQILHGKDPRDALVYTPRICGICSVSQSVAAAHALAQAMSLTPTQNGVITTNLILGCENAADHLTHFYLFFMPDFARQAYSNKTWFSDIKHRFAAQTGTASAAMLKTRADWLHLTGILAGKWPHSLAIQPGGTTKSIQPQERIRMLTIIGAFRQFLEETLFDDNLESITALDSNHALRHWHASHLNSDFGTFLTLADDLGLGRLGELDVPLMSYGAYAGHHGKAHAFDAGIRLPDGTIRPLNPQSIQEDISHSWLSSDDGPQHPYDGYTIPNAAQQEDPENPAYSWCKAPRMDRDAIEVGALARQAVNGHALILDLLTHNSTSVRSRIIARLLELAHIVIMMEGWVKDLEIGEPYCAHSKIPDEAQGAGMVEAARGSLGHWIKIKKGRIFNYQIIAPTTWNFSPRDRHGNPGALEQALVGAPVHEDDDRNLAIAHIVRSFDPCMVCTVH